MSTGFTAFVALFDPLNIFNETAPFINQIGSGINHQNTYIPPTRSPPTQGPTPVTRAPHNTNKHNMVARSLRIFAPSAIKQVAVIPAHPAEVYFFLSRHTTRNAEGARRSAAARIFWA